MLVNGYINAVYIETFAATKSDNTPLNFVDEGIVRLELHARGVVLSTEGDEPAISFIDGGLGNGFGVDFGRLSDSPTQLTPCLLSFKAGQENGTPIAAPGLDESFTVNIHQC